MLEININQGSADSLYKEISENIDNIPCNDTELCEHCEIMQDLMQVCEMMRDIYVRYHALKLKSLKEGSI